VAIVEALAVNSIVQEGCRVWSNKDWGKVKNDATLLEERNSNTRRRMERKKRYPREQGKRSFWYYSNRGGKATGLDNASAVDFQKRASQTASRHKSHGGELRYSRFYHYTFKSFLRWE